MSTFRRILVALFCLVMTGCASFHVVEQREPTITWHVDKSFDNPAQRQCLEDSGKAWVEQTSHLVEMSFKYDYDQTSLSNVLEHKLDDKIIKWHSDTPEVLEFEREKMLEEHVDEWTLAGLTSNKITDPVSLPIQIALVEEQLYTPNRCRLVAMHEMGHALGVPHMGNPTDIMYPSIMPYRSACLKHDDLMGFSIMNDHPMDLMKPCPDQTVDQMMPPSAPGVSDVPKTD